MESKLPGARALVSESWSLAFSRWKQFLKVIGWPLGLSAVSQILIISGNTLLIIVGVLTAIAGVVLALLMKPALVDTARLLINDPNTNISTKAQYSFATKNFWSYIWVAILVSVFLLGALFLLAIPAMVVSGLLTILHVELVAFSLAVIWMVAVIIALSIYVTFAVQAVLLDGVKGIAAIMESFAMVKDRWWAVFGRSILFALTVLGAYVIFIAVVLLVALLLGPSKTTPVTTIINAILSLGISTIVVPLATIWSVKMYKALKSTRTETKSISRGWTLTCCWVGLFVPIIISIVIVVVGAIGLVSTLRQAGSDAAAGGAYNGTLIQGGTGTDYFPNGAPGSATQ